MAHPKIACPEHLKPLFKLVRADTAKEFANAQYGYSNMPLYLCFTVERVCRASAESDTPVEDISRLRAGCYQLIEASINTKGSFGAWLVVNDEKAAQLSETFEAADAETEEACHNALTAYENQCRLDWLDFLIGDKDETPTTQVP